MGTERVAFGRRQVARDGFQRPGKRLPIIFRRATHARTSSSFHQTSIVFDRASGEEKLQLRGHENVVETAEFAPVVSYAVIRQMTGITVSPNNQYEDDCSFCVPQASPTDERAKQPGCFVATGSRDKTIRIWDGLSGQCLKVLVRTTLFPTLLPVSLLAPVDGP